MKTCQKPKAGICRQVYGLLLGVLALLLGACVENYELPSENSDLQLLVVDGSIDLDVHVAVIQLSRTQSLSSADQPPTPEKGATVAVETDEGQRYPLPENRFIAGRYVGFNAAWQYGKKYRLHIKTSQGKEYASSWVTTQATPPIESLTWQVEDGKVKLQVSTQDPTRQTRYYRWEYVETYEYRAYFESMFMFTPTGDIVARPPSAQIYTCWKTTPSTQILVGTSGQLSEDRISGFTLATHEGNGDRFSRRYSLLVRQYALSREEYDYWLLLQKNTENVGSLFDAQPSYVTGNLNCLTDAQEPVMGFFSARSMREKRLFITASELAPFHFTQPMPYCAIIEPTGADLTPYMNNTEVLSDKVISLASKECADCRLKGGSNLKPSFW